MIKYWQYRAIDAQLQISEGLAHAPSFLQLSVSLRQRGLQVIQASQVQADQVLADNRLSAMKRLLQPQPQVIRRSNTSGIVQRCMRFLFRL